VAVAGAFVALWNSGRGTDPDEVAAYLRSESAGAASTATEVITTLMNYDSASVEDRQDDLLPLATGEFREQYETLLEQGLGDVLRRTSAASTGEIVAGPDIGFITATRATAIVRVLQEVTSDEVPEGRQIFYVMQLELVDDGDGWLADELTILSQQSLEDDP
jgi:hypothetical protein